MIHEPQVQHSLALNQFVHISQMVRQAEQRLTNQGEKLSLMGQQLSEAFLATKGVHEYVQHDENVKKTHI